MQIVCTTTQAATNILLILLSADLQPAQDFELRPILATTPPLTFTLLTALPHQHQAKIRAVPDTTISE